MGSPHRAHASACGWHCVYRKVPQPLDYNDPIRLRHEVAIPFQRYEADVRVVAPHGGWVRVHTVSCHHPSRIRQGGAIARVGLDWVRVRVRCCIRSIYTFRHPAPRKHVGATCKYPLIGGLGLGSAIVTTGLGVG